MQLPEHVIQYKNETYRAQINAEGAVAEDYGFTFLSNLSNQYCLLHFGIRAFGSHIAVKSFLELPRNSNGWNVLRDHREAMLLSKGTVLGMDLIRCSVVKVVDPLG
jgi:hypothetical protein